MRRQAIRIVLILSALFATTCTSERALPIFAPGDGPPGSNTAVVFGRIDVRYGTETPANKSFDLHIRPVESVRETEGFWLTFRSGQPFYVVMPAGIYRIEGAERPAMTCNGVTFSVPEGGAAYLGALLIADDWHTFAPDSIGVDVRDDYDAARSKFADRYPNFGGAIVKSLIAIPAPERRGASVRSACQSTAGSVVFPVSIFFGF